MGSLLSDRFSLCSSCTSWLLSDSISSRCSVLSRQSRSPTRQEAYSTELLLDGRDQCVTMLVVNADEHIDNAIAGVAHQLDAAWRVASETQMARGILSATGFCQVENHFLNIRSLLKPSNRALEIFACRGVSATFARHRTAILL